MKYCITFLVAFICFNACSQNKLIVQRIDNGHIRTIKKGKVIGIDSLKNNIPLQYNKYIDPYKVYTLTDSSFTLESTYMENQFLTYKYKDVASIQYRADNGRMGAGPLPILGLALIITSIFQKGTESIAVLSSGVFISGVAVFFIIRSHEHSYRILRLKR